MRSSTFLTTVIALFFALLAPVLAQDSSSFSSNSYTTTKTITLVAANATSYVHYTSSMPSAGLASATTTASLYSSPSLTAMPSANPSVCTNCMGNGAGTQHSNLIAVGLAGVVALFWSTL